MDKLYSFGAFLLRHKFLVTFLFFALLVVLLDENSFVERHKRQQTIATLQEEIDRYHQRYDMETARLESLDTSYTALEHLAREEYLMKRPNEDVFVLR